ncbi:MAG: DUF3040 domain-containing protein [Actinobacteria bacterium]|nr:DUF3040 domain-containing protein [Actinomycetota bacterium]
MPLSDHEQRILEEIERRLAEEDPQLVDQVERTTLSSHLARRIRLAALGFLVGLIALFFFAVSIWWAIAGFGLMVASTLAITRYLRQLGRDQVRALQEQGRFSLAGVLGRLATRFRPPGEPPRP